MKIVLEFIGDSLSFLPLMGGLQQFDWLFVF